MITEYKEEDSVDGSMMESDLLQIKAKQDHFKRMLKLKIFRGYYLERRFVETIKDYRDIIALHSEEKEMQKQLLFIRHQLHFDFLNSVNNIWIGITNEILDIIQPKFSMATYVWTELDTLPYGEYWFNIKSVKIRQEEIVLKVKVLQPVTSSSLTSAIPSLAYLKTEPKENRLSLTPYREISGISNTNDIQVNFQDFFDILKSWWISFKVTIYNFMANDITKENILNCLRFFGLLILSLGAGLVVVVKYFGIFSIKVLIELRNLLHVLTPVLLSMINMFGKIMGGFYILLAMIWRDTVRKDAPNQMPPFDPTKSLQYNKTRYKAIRPPPSYTNFQTS